MKNLLTSCMLFSVLFLSGCNLSGTEHNKQFEQLASQIVEYRKSIDFYASKTGVNGYLLPDLSHEFLVNNYNQNKQFLSELKLINLKSLNRDNQINLPILISQVQNNVDEYAFKSHYMPLTSEFGFHSSMSFLTSQADFSTKKGYELYLQRLEEIPRYFSENIYWMKQGIKIGFTQPKAVLVDYEQSILAFIKPPEESIFYAPFKTNQAKLTDAEFSQLQKLATKVIAAQVNPAFDNYYTFFVNEYYPAAREDIGISTVESGTDFYKNRVQHYTTTQMTPLEIHELGLSEVKRIRAEMDKVIEQVGFKGNFAEFVHFLRTDPQFYAKTPEQLLMQAAYIAKKVDATLPKLFNHLPRTPYGVAPVPDSIAPKYTTGRYIGPNRDDQAGFYWVNTYGLDKRPLYVLEALTLHEAVPGHHLQISLNSELKHLPEYRKNAYISAFGEGWGLYAEWLGLEAGFYQDPYSNFGRLTYEMWRAARLVLDTGIHMYGWSKERAMNFMKDNTALSLHNIKTETDRYISWPGQALSYKIGELTIKRLRAQSEKALGEKFDLREFHNQILKNGSVPLSILESQINQYITDQLKQE